MNKDEAIKVIQTAYEIDLKQNDLYEVLKPLVDYANKENVKIEITGVF